jgi:hypothetical protein
LGLIQLELKNYKSSLEYHKKALDIFNSQSDGAQTSVSSTLNNIGTVYYK